MNWKKAQRTISWHLACWLNRLEWMHVAAMGILALWAMLIGIVDAPLYIETRDMALQMASYRTLVLAKAQSAAQASSPRDVAHEFIAALPPFEKYTEQLRVLHALADKTGISVARIGYRYEQMPALPITKMALQMDVQGDELQQRQFLQNALNTFQNLSIARLSYAKATDRAGKFDQTLHVNLYYELHRKAAS